jgi:hypothetical protein
MALESVLIAMGGDTRSALASRPGPLAAGEPGKPFCRRVHWPMSSPTRLMLEGDFERARIFSNEARLVQRRNWQRAGPGLRVVRVSA